MNKKICTFLMVCLIIVTFTACNNQEKTIIEDKDELEVVIPVVNDNEITPKVTVSNNETLAYEQLNLPENFEEEAYGHIENMVSFGIREAGSDAEAAADEYIMKCLKQSGIEAVKEEFNFKYYNLGNVLVNGKEISYDKICFNPYENTKLNGEGVIFIKSKDQSSEIVLLPSPEEDYTLYDIDAKTIICINQEDYNSMLKETYNSVLKDTVIQVDINAEIEERISYNVVATINSTKKDAKSIIISAHMDSKNGPGADDNASGVGVALELAKYYASKRESLPYNIKFIFYGAEELGLLGAQAYINEHEKELSDCVLVFNIDGIGGKQIYIETGEDEQGTSNNLQAPNTDLYAEADYECKWFNNNLEFGYMLPEWLLENIKDCCDELNYEYNSSNGMGSDHQIFGRYGIPATNIALYDKDTVIHCPEDTPDKVNKESLLKAGKIVAAVVNKTMMNDSMK